uniref:NADH-ubiquinone oxidoreductase chain 2 n=1 Tax=Epuraea guttata TaxID=1903846 RepID=A0A343C1G4_9CUCU|nr:NADH dehydrogenase subunit 2 [Epuraea guttata]
MLFFNTMIMGTLLTISSISWFSMWMGLEINLLSIIPLMKSSKNLFPSEASIKYFITQTLASSIILLTIIMNLHLEEFIPLNSNLYVNIMMNSGFLTKMGAAPFHFWFPEVMEGLNWNLCLIMLTWQKIAPMIILIYNLNMTMFLSMIIIMSSFISSILGMNQISLRKILTFSSINHIGWMIASMLSSISIWMVYFLIYSIISINIILILKNLNVFYMKQLLNSMNYNKLIKILFILNFFSLGGLPPFLGFMPKWLTINFLIENNFYFMSTILITITLMSLYFYMRITFSAISIYSCENIQMNNPKIKFSTMMFNFLSISGLFMSTFILSI